LLLKIFPYNFNLHFNSALGSYTKKVFQLRKVLETSAANFDLLRYLEDPSDSGHELSVRGLVQQLADVYKIEYVTILAPDMTILTSANVPRRGQVFNPQVPPGRVRV
jgi:hypothetical protein